MKHELIKTENYLLIVDDSKKTIAHLPLNGAPVLEGVDLLPPLEDDVEQMINNLLIDKYGVFSSDQTVIKTGKAAFKDGFKEGYNKAKEKYKYTEEDIEYLYNLLTYDDLAEDEKIEACKEYIKSLKQPKMPVGFECEDEVYMYSINGDIMKPKTTTNSQGQSVWVGKYIFKD